MTKKEKLIEILYSGLLEIRLLANRNSEDRRIVNLTNILHNLPKAVIDDEGFDYELLKNNLSEYQKQHKDDCMDFIKFLKED